MSELPSVLDCDPEELATFLLYERFDNNSKETATFLLQALSCLPDAEGLSTELLDKKEEDDKAAINLGEPLTPPVEVSMTMPRAKLTCSLLAEGMYCVNSKEESFSILPQNVSKLLTFPKAEDVRKKEVRHMILLILKEEVVFKKKPLNQICFQLPPQNPSTFLEELQACLKLREDDICNIGGESNGWNFQSHDAGNTSTTTAGMPFVTCYKGVQDGHLYPLEEGLLFFKPPHFIPRQSLHSIACGRGASGSSRYVDMNIQLENDSTIEFTNIHREELNVLNDYIHKVLIPAMKKDAGTNDDNTNEDETESDDAGEDDDDEMSESRRPRRKASRDARHTTKKEMEMGEEESDDDGEEDGDEDFLTQEDNELDSEESETEQLDGSEDGDLESGENREDEFDEDEFFEDVDSDDGAGEDDEDATEEEDFQPNSKRSKTVDHD